MDSASDLINIQERLNNLRIEHRDLDAAIDGLGDQSTVDMFALQRLKKRKLGLKDQIALLESQLIPDIIA